MFLFSINEKIYGVFIPLDATIYVGGLDDKVTESLMWELFVQSGPVGESNNDYWQNSMPGGNKINVTS